MQPRPLKSQPQALGAGPAQRNAIGLACLAKAALPAVCFDANIELVSLILADLKATRTLNEICQLGFAVATVIEIGRKASIAT